jgi:peptide/nickel transport system substrate-binding protein
MVWPMVYESLLDFTPDSEGVEAGLASKWKVSADGLSYSFDIDPRARFSDGSPIEPKDVIFSIARQRALGPAAYMFEAIENVEQTSPSQVTFQLAHRHVEFLQLIASPFAAVINSDEAVAIGATLDPKTDAAESWFYTASLGSGPYTLSAYETDKRIVLERNQKYWQDADQHFDRIVMLHVPSAATQVAMLLNGQADIGLSVDYASLRQIDPSQLKVSILDAPEQVYLALGPGSAAAAGQLPLKVRQAIVHAIDYDALIEIFTEGNGRRMSTFIPLGFPGSGGGSMPSYDPDLARQLLSQSGIENVAFQIDFPDSTANGVPFVLLFQKIQQDLAAVGIDMTLAPAIDSVITEGWNTGAFAATAFDWQTDFYGASPLIDGFGHWEGSWLAGVTSLKDVEDALMPETKGEFVEALQGDPANYDASVRDLAERMSARAVLIPLFSPGVIRVTRPEISGFTCTHAFNCGIQEAFRAQ